MTTTRGIVCPFCPGRSFRTVYTRHRPSVTIRVRACKACGKRIRTAEKVAGVARTPTESTDAVPN